MCGQRERTMTRLLYPAFILTFTIGLSCQPAQNAVSAILTNADRDDYTITVIKGETRTTQTVKQGALVKGLCPDGCIVRLNDDPKRDFILEGRERVTIEDGLLYYDGEMPSKAQSRDD